MHFAETMDPTALFYKTENGFELIIQIQTLFMLDPSRPPQRLLDEVERARQIALGRYRGSLSRRMNTSPTWR